MSTVFYPEWGTEKAVELAANTKVGPRDFFLRLQLVLPRETGRVASMPAQSCSFAAPEWVSPDFALVV